MSYLKSPLASRMLVDYLNRNPHARKHFPKFAKDELQDLALKLAPDLAKDIALEAVGELWLQLEGKKPNSFDPARGSAKSFLVLRLRDSIKTVRASYAPPGHTTRMRVRKENASRPVQPPTIPLDSLEEEALSEDLMDPMATVEKLEARIDAHRLLKKAEPGLKEALILQFFDRLKHHEAAEEAGISRFKFNRLLDAFRKENIR